jgi:hypothetical protein
VADHLLVPRADRLDDACGVLADGSLEQVAQRAGPTSSSTERVVRKTTLGPQARKAWSRWSFGFPGLCVLWPEPPA